MRQAQILEIGTPPPVLGEVLDFMRLLLEVNHAVERTSKHLEKTLGVTSSQRLVVRIVGRFPGISAGKLAQLLHVHPGTLTGILKRLERRGLVRRRSDSRDRRRHLLSLTEKGRVLDIETAGTVEAAIARTLKSIHPNQLQAASELLVKVVDNLSNSELGAVKNQSSGASR